MLPQYAANSEIPLQRIRNPMNQLEKAALVSQT